MELLRKKQRVEIGIQNILSGGSGNGEETFYEPSCVIICKFIFLSSFHFCATTERSGARGRRGGGRSCLGLLLVRSYDIRFRKIIMATSLSTPDMLTYMSTARKKVGLIFAKESRERPEKSAAKP